MTTKKKALAYVRISSESQESNTSLENQKAAIIAYCIQYNYELVETPFIDIYSGDAEERAGLEALRQRVKLKNFDAVIIYKIDRFCRSVILGETVRQEIEANGGQLISVMEQIDTSNPMGLLFMHLLEAFAQYEKSTILWRLATGKRRTVTTKGGWLGGVAPIGYKALGSRERPSGGVLSVDEEEAEIVRTVLRLRDDKKSLQEIADELNNSGLKTRLRITKKGKTLGGHPFNKVTVHRILQRKEVYRGIKPINSSYTLENCQPCQPILIT